MRADRLVAIIMLLQKEGQMTAKKLAKKLEVSERTVHRDMESLSAAGIPVFAERGNNGGWRLLDNYQTKLTGLKESEIRALFVPPSNHMLSDLGLKSLSEQARNKLIASLPQIYRDDAIAVWNRIHVDTSTWRKKESKNHSFDILKNAIWENNKLNIVYIRANGTKTKRVVEPLGLVTKGSVWYLVASQNGEFRNYRTSRIQTAELTEETFDRPKQFNLVEYWESSTASFIENMPTYPVKVEVTKAILPRLSWTNRFVQVEELGKGKNENWRSVELFFQTESEAIGYILGFANQIKVIEPKQLHDQILKMAEATVAFYKNES